MLRFIVLIFANLAGHMCAEDWTYDLEIKWPGYCNTGNVQSPINIVTADAIVDKHEVNIRGPLVFRGYNSVNMTAENNGHTLKWTVTPDSPPPVLSGGPLRGNYSLIQFHLHWLSEHAIDGMKHPVEIHFVHVKTGLTVTEALKRPDGLAVIGILCKVNSGKESEIALAELAPALPMLVDRNTGYANATVLDLSRLFSPEMQSFFTYHGSLTTPQCQEVVTWIVMDKPLSISDIHYKLISKADVGGTDNFRSLQPANRVVYRSIASCASVSLPGSLGIIASLFNISSALSSSINKGLCALINLKKRFFGSKTDVCAKSVL